MTEMTPKKLQAMSWTRPPSCSTSLVIVFPKLMPRVTDWKLARADVADRVSQAATVQKVKQLLAQHVGEIGSRCRESVVR